MADTLVLVGNQFFRYVRTNGCLNGRGDVLIPVFPQGSSKRVCRFAEHPYSVEQVNGLLRKHGVNVRVKYFKNANGRSERES